MRNASLRASHVATGQQGRQTSSHTFSRSMVLTGSAIDALNLASIQLVTQQTFVNTRNSSASTASQVSTQLVQPQTRQTSPVCHQSQYVKLKLQRYAWKSRSNWYS